MDIELDPPFFVKGWGTEEFFIVPYWDHAKGEMEYTVFQVDENLGMIRCADIHHWEPIKGSLTRGQAQIIGLQIESHDD